LGPQGAYRRTGLGSGTRLGYGAGLGTGVGLGGQRVGVGPSLELYVNTPMSAAPDELRTQLYLPLA